MEYTLTEQFNTTPEKLYKLWLTSSGHSQMTGNPAIISSEIGGKFTAWEGYISGTNLELVPFTKIKQSWRTTDFPDSQADSLIEITLNEIKPGITQLTLTHSNLAGADDKQYIDGWKDYYFKQMKDYFKQL